MKGKGIIALSLLMIVALFFCFATYILLPKEIRWIISAVVEVPNCHSLIADKLNTQTDTLRSYVLETLQPGMTSYEVESVLNQIAPSSVIDTFIGHNRNIYKTMRVDLCSNPFGDVILGLYYSKDGYLINAVDEWAD